MILKGIKSKNIDTSEIKASNNFKLRLLFNLSCLTKAKVIFIFAIIYILTSFIFPIVCFFIKIQIASISWIYILVISILILIIQIISVFILNIENRGNSIDHFFTSKGYTNLSSFLIKTLSIYLFTFSIAIIQTILMVVFMYIFKFDNSVLQFLVMNSIGAICFSFLVLPIFSFISLFNSRILFSIISFIILILPFSSLGSRFFPIDSSVYIYDGNNTSNYVSSYNFKTKESSTLAVANYSGKIHNNLIQEAPSYTPYLPGELFFAPFNITYQVNQEFNETGINNIKNFQTDINRPNFINNGNDYYVNNCYIFRPLDGNIVNFSDGELREKIILPFLNFYYKYDTIYHFSQMNIKEVFDNAFSEIFVDMNNFIVENPAIFYFYRIAQIYNSKLNEVESTIEPELEKFVKEKIYKIVDAIKCATSPSFGLFLEASIKPPKTELPDNYNPGKTFTIKNNTILGIITSSNLANNINRVFPYGNLINPKYYSPILDTDYINFSTKFISEPSFKNGSVEVIFPRRNDTNNVTNKERVYIADELTNYESNLFPPSKSEPNKNYAIDVFIKRYKDEFANEYPEPEKVLANPSQWTNQIFSLWNNFLKDNYLWFSEYIDILRSAIDKQKQNFSIKVKPYLSYFSLSNNNVSTTYESGEPYNFNYLFHGQMVYTSFNPNIWFGFALLVVISLSCWIILIMSNNRKKR